MSRVDSLILYCFDELVKTLVKQKIRKNKDFSTFEYLFKN